MWLPGERAPALWSCTPGQASRLSDKEDRLDNRVIKDAAHIAFRMGLRLNLAGHRDAVGRRIHA